MKINEIHLDIHNGKVVLCRKNKRGQTTSEQKDITGEFLNLIADVIKSDDGYHKTFKTPNGKFYDIDCTEISKEELELQNKKRDIRGKNSLFKLQSLISAFNYSTFGIR